MHSALNSKECINIAPAAAGQTSSHWSRAHCRTALHSAAHCRRVPQTHFCNSPAKQAKQSKPDRHGVQGRCKVGVRRKLPRRLLLTAGTPAESIKSVSDKVAQTKDTCALINSSSVFPGRGNYGFMRQSTFLCTNWQMRGYMPNLVKFILKKVVNISQIMALFSSPNSEYIH